MRMARWAIVWAVLGLACWPALARAETEPETVVGTVIAMRQMEGQAASEWDLRVDQSGKESKAAPGETLTVMVRDGIPGLEQVGLGDQVRTRVLGAEGRSRELVGVERLGRGEFLNPGRNPSLDLGSPQARVLVKMFAPLHADCHRQTADLLQELAAKYPEQVRVQIFDLSQAAARQELARERLTCATVLVNNRYEFSLRDEAGRERKVQLWHRPNTPQSSYNSEDAGAVVEQEIERLYPSPPGDVKSV